MPSVDPEVLLLNLVKLHNNLCSAKEKSRNKIITALLEKECNHLFNIITTIQRAFPCDEYPNPSEEV